MKRRVRKAHCPLGCPRENSVGYCRLHRSCLSVRQMKNRECLRKQCQHFRPRKEHGYWATKRPAWYEPAGEKEDFRNE